MDDLMTGDGPVPPLRDELSRVRSALLDADDFEARPPATEEQVAAFEERFGVLLPPEFRAFLLEVADGLWSDDEPWLYGLEDMAHEIVGDRTDPAGPFWYTNADADAIRAAIVAIPEDGSLLEDERLAALQKDGAPDGCLTVAGHGGNDFTVLVVTGEQAGRLWRTGDVDIPETREFYSGETGATPLGFLSWLELCAESR
ncbi:SMI1/KNR4 family protein [Sphaerisporangium sp. NPDC051017]|uniref:SMI1/KNR4 family protein n=1 Tax=Sphaerisporangium sp. NPDC051017 TaxID=3154636 RepID=UPI003427E0C9